jgi:hypothetical protein
LEDTTMVIMEGDLDTMVIIEVYDFYKAYISFIAVKIKLF